MKGTAQQLIIADQCEPEDSELYVPYRVCLEINARGNPARI